MSIHPAQMALFAESPAECNWGTVASTDRHYFSNRGAGRILSLALILVCGSLLSFAQTEPKFSVYPVPIQWGDVNSITTGPDAALWFTTNNSICRFTTAGVMSEFPLPDDGRFYSGGRGASSITRGPDDALWFTEIFANKIGRITTAGAISEYFLENSAASPQKIVAAPDGALWFTEFLNHNGRIGRISVDGTISEYELSPCQGNCGRYPNGITAGPDNSLWFTDLGDGRIHSITTDGTITDYGSVAPFGNAPGAITTGPDRALWFTAPTTNSGTDALGRITADGEMTLFPLPLYSRPTYNSYNIEPVSITTGPDGALWFTSQTANAFGRMTTDGKVTLYRLPEESIVIADGYQRFSSITLGPDGALWIGTPRFIVRASIKTDMTPPAITMRATPTILQPPDGHLVPVAISGKITDTESGVLTSSATFTVIDEYSLVRPRGPVSLDSSGHYSFVVHLVASRKGVDRNGRCYSIQVKARDNTGNWGVTTATVIVPHDQR